ADPKAPLVQLLQGLDKYVGDRPTTRLKAFAVFLYGDLTDTLKDDDVREAHADELRTLKSAEPPLQQVVLCLDSAATLQKSGYDLKPDERIKVVLYDELKVKKVYAVGDE